MLETVEMETYCIRKDVFNALNKMPLMLTNAYMVLSEYNSLKLSTMDF